MHWGNAVTPSISLVETKTKAKVDLSTEEGHAALQRIELVVPRGRKKTWGNRPPHHTELPATVRDSLRFRMMHDHSMSDAS